MKIKKIIFLCFVLILLCGMGALSFAKEENLTDAEYWSLRIPQSVYSAEKSDSQTVDVSDYTGILVQELRSAGVLSGGYRFFEPPTEEQMRELPRIPVATVRETLDRLFGPGSGDRAIGSELFYFNGVTTPYRLLYSEEENAYIYYPYSAGGGDPRISEVYEKLLRVETEGENKIMYSVYVRYVDGVNDGNTLGDLKGYYYLRGYDPEVEGHKFFARFESDVRDEVFSGAYDEYLPLFRHEFRPNGDGSYYWAETVVVEAGKQPTPEPGTDSDEGSTTTEAVDPETTAPVTDTPTTDTPTTDNGDAAVSTIDTPPTDGAAEEASFPWIWVGIGGAAVIVALGAILLLKKKK